jgi:AraC family transcriptional regulator
MDTGREIGEGAAEADRALSFIEANLFAPLSVGDIAATCGLSAYHFSRLFTARHGESVMAYVRRRRMEIAAQRLAAEPDVKLIDLALETGFESQEAFTRAFVRAFGDSPGRFRRLVAKRVEPPKEMNMNLTPVLQQSRETRPAFRVAGYAGRFDEETRWKIPHLWQQMAPRMGFRGQDGYETYGVCWDADANDGGFRYMAGCALKPGAAAPEGMETVAIPAQTYLVFRQALTADPLHPQMTAAAREIWSNLLPNSGCPLARGPDFEFYPADFAPMQDGKWVAWYIPIAA